MTTKEKYERARLLSHIIKVKCGQLEALRALAENVPVVGSGEHVQTTLRTDRIESVVARIVDLEDEICADIERHIEAMREVNTLIDAVTDIKTKLILIERYINCRTWEDVAEMLDYSTPRVYSICKKYFEEQ